MLNDINYFVFGTSEHFDCTFWFDIAIFVFEIPVFLVLGFQHKHASNLKLLLLYQVILPMETIRAVNFCSKYKA